MAQARSLRDLQRAPGEPPLSGGPRFALRFEDGGGQLILAKPHAFAYGVVDELELNLGELRFPLDLSAGPSRFRTRRTTVRAARVRIDLPSLFGALVDEPFALTPLAPIDGGMALALRDAFGTIALDVLARFEGSRLRVVPSRARAVHEGPAAPLIRALVAARALGFTIEEDRGALVAPRALSMVLLEALTPWGWRVPDDRSARLAIEILGASRVALRTLAEGESAPLDAPGRWERARRLAPVTSRLALGDREGARAEWSALVERHPDLDGAELGFSAPALDGSDTPARAAALRASLRRGDARESARLAEELAAVEPCDTLAVDGLCAAAGLVLETDPDRAASLLERASARRPSEASLALQLIAAAARAGDLSALRHFLQDALATREPGAERGAFARDAAVLCELAGHRDAAVELFESAVEALPHDAGALEGLARARARRGQTRAALDLWDRAAAERAASCDGEGEASALRASAELALLLDEPEMAEVRLTQASKVYDSASTWAALASVRRGLDRDGPARRAEDRLLDAVQREFRLDAELSSALESAARAAFADGHLERARAWRDALRRARPDHAALDELDALVGDARPSPEEPLGEPAREPEGSALDDDVSPQAEEDFGPAGPSEPLLDLEGDLEGSLRALMARGDSDAISLAAPIFVSRADEITDGALLLSVAGSVEGGGRLTLYQAAHDRLAASGLEGPAALALGHLGAERRDTAMLRAALTRAERAGEPAVALQIVELALSVVTRGPARAALERVQLRLREELGIS